MTQYNYAGVSSVNSLQYFTSKNILMILVSYVSCSELARPFTPRR